MSPGAPTTDHCEGESPGAWCAGTNTSNYVTISVKGLALGHKHQLTLGIPAAHCDPMPRITDQMLHNIDTHKIFLFTFFRTLWYRGSLISQSDLSRTMWKAVRGMSEMPHHDVLTLGLILYSLANTLLWEANTGKRALTFNIRIMVPLPGCCVFLFFCRRPQYFDKNSVGL